MAIFNQSIVTGHRVEYQQWSLVTHRYAKLQQSHADDISGAVSVADRKCLGLVETL